MAQTNVKAVTLSTFNAAALNNVAFQAINAAGLTAACFFIRVVNDSNTDIFISLDGINDHEYVPQTSEFDFPAQANAQPNAFGALIAKGTIIYVRGVAGVGTITLSGYYV